MENKKEIIKEFLEEFNNESNIKVSESFLELFQCDEEPLLMSDLDIITGIDSFGETEDIVLVKDNKKTILEEISFLLGDKENAYFSYNEDSNLKDNEIIKVLEEIITFLNKKIKEY